MNNYAPIRPASSQRRRQRQSGVSIFLFGFCLAVLVPVIGLAVDVTLMYLAQTKLSAAVDAAALSGARALSRGSSDVAQQQAAADTATSYFLKNYPVGYLSTTSITTPTVQIVNSANLRTVTVTSSIQFPLTFLRWLGTSNNTLNATATATRKDVNVMMVLDHSGSLFDSGSCEPMKDAATAFLQQFAQGRDNVGLVTFATGSAVDVPLTQNFLSGGTNIAAVISGISCANSTNSSSGLWKAYEQLAAYNEPNALNAVLFFTDGMPTVFTAWNRVTNTGCSAVGWSKGVVGNGGVGDPNQTASQGESALASTGCSWSGASDTSDIVEVWNRDAVGNAVDISYAPVVLTGMNLVNTADNMRAAALNATISAGQRIRSGVQVLNWNPSSGATGSGPSVPRVVIYSIGLGNSGAPPDANLLMTVSNDPRSPSLDPTTAQGLYIFAQNANALAPAFQRVASELLRLAR